MGVILTKAEGRAEGSQKQHIPSKNKSFLDKSIQETFICSFFIIHYSLFFSLLLVASSSYCLVYSL